VQSYYEILEDTLLGLRLAAWRRSPRKRLAAHPKFYLFDLGVANALNRRLSEPPDPAARGRLFEAWVVLETHRRLAYALSEARLFYWRTNHGAEVDLLIERGGRPRAAVEIKAKSNPGGSDLSGLRAFGEDYPDCPRFLVCETPHSYDRDGVSILPWEEYLALLPRLA
jgi:predicted AAA+ superfamily ATPase